MGVCVIFEETFFLEELVPEKYRSLVDYLSEQEREALSWYSPSPGQKRLIRHATLNCVGIFKEIRYRKEKNSLDLREPNHCFRFSFQLKPEQKFVLVTYRTESRAPKRFSVGFGGNFIGLLCSKDIVFEEYRKLKVGPRIKFHEDELWRDTIRNAKSVIQQTSQKLRRVWKSIFQLAIKHSSTKFEYKQKMSQEQVEDAVDNAYRRTEARPGSITCEFDKIFETEGCKELPEATSCSFSRTLIKEVAVVVGRGIREIKAWLREECIASSASGWPQDLPPTELARFDSSAKQLLKVVGKYR